MPGRPFTAIFTQHLPIPKAGITAVAVRWDRLRRSETVPGEAAMQGREYTARQGVA